MLETTERFGVMVSYLESLTRAIGAISVPELLFAADLVETAYLDGRTIYTCGNGGSAATAAHLAVDLAKNTRLPGVAQVRTMSLVDNVPPLTAWANDVSYESVFSGQLTGLAAQGDVLIAISISGNSPNVLEALRVARDLGVHTVDLLGPTGGRARDLCDAWIAAPAPSIEEQEDVHMAFAHILTRHMRNFVAEHAAVGARC
ncbi:D-sedoheptulose-7-phosphate isomerase [Streptomyces sp. YGL11-2]|uniref:D-sedoheptulose-7-phosphate isomerase n=1 Tax=Streptomyces sp. YGL11-2 TaxID=3414028 RepID=UPI003CEEC2D0